MSFWEKISSFFERKTIERANKVSDKVTKQAKQIEELLTESREAVKVKPIKTEEKPVRARTKKGTFVADDKSTKDVNEAWKGGKAPAKTSKKKPKVIRRKKSR
jgi:hypothetical protein